MPPIPLKKKYDIRVDSFITHTGPKRINLDLLPRHIPIDGSSYTFPDDKTQKRQHAMQEDEAGEESRLMQNS